MAEPQIVPPPPTVNQGDAQIAESVRKAFDRVLPPTKTTASTEAPPEPEPLKPQAPPEPEPPPPPQPEPKPAEADVPSFLEQALRGTASPEAVKSEEEWPEELPQFKTPEESKARYKKWRETYGSLKQELEGLKSRPAQDPQVQQRMQLLEGQNKQMAEMLSRFGVEQSAEFQQNIIRPLYAAWNEASRIVKDAGGDPQDLAKAMALSGKSQFEALDELFMGMPESARSEAHDALRTYRRFEDARRSTMQNAPQALEGIRKREMERQMGDLNRQRADMKNIFERTVKNLRENAKLEVLLRTESPEGKWWNEQGDKILDQGRNLYLENTDMERVALACILAPAAESYRNLWINSQKKIGELQRIIAERINNEPNLSESSGSGTLPSSEAQLRDDLKKPFAEVFLREFHRQQAQSR